MILEEAHGGVVTLTLNRPDAYNAINPELRDALVAALDRAARGGERCIVVRGAGRGFCAGIDLKVGTGGNDGFPVMEQMRTSTQALVRAVLSCPVPIVTAVHGVCAGVALVLALGADHCIAADDARFAAAFVRRGLVPDGATTFLLPRLTGMTFARRMLLFGEDVTAPTALAAGMIGEVVPAADLAGAATARAQQLAALPAATLSYTKALLARSFELDLDATLLAERAGQALMTTTPDYTEGVAAFFERRPPQFNRG